jgi:hypothetical protein
LHVAQPSTLRLNALDVERRFRNRFNSEPCNDRDTALPLGSIQQSLMARFARHHLLGDRGRSPGAFDPDARSGGTRHQRRAKPRQQ